MNDGAYEELGGTAETNDSTDAWDVGGAIYEPCKECGAGRDVRCRNPITGDERHSPCVSRLKGAS